MQLSLQLTIKRKRSLVKEKAAAVTSSPSALKPSIVPVEPLTPQELKEMLAKSKQSEDDDCLMCGS